MNISEEARHRLVKTGKIFSNYCLAAGVLMLVVALAPIMTVFWYVAAFLTLVLLFAFKLVTLWQVPYSMVKMAHLFFDDSTRMINIVYSHASAALPYVFGVTAALAAAAIVLLLVFDRYHRKGRVVVAGIAVVLGIFALVSVYKFGGFFA